MQPLLGPIEGADHREVGGVQLDVVKAGNGRVKRAVYPPGFRWSTHMKKVVGTDLCLHAHLGFLAQGHIKGEYADGCGFDFTAPRVFVIEPGQAQHDAGGGAAVAARRARWRRRHEPARISASARRR